MNPVRLYLDSSDYSTLSDPRVLTAETRAIRDQLLAWVSANTLTVFFSQALLVEMAPISQGSEHPAQARAELLYALCGKNALLSQDRLIELELKKLFEGNDQAMLSPYSYEGIWYASGADDLPSPYSSQEILAQGHQEIATMGLNREQRRQAKRRLRRNRSTLQGLVKLQARSLVVSDEEARVALAGYPLKAEELILVMRYLASGDGLEDAQSAYRRSLSDPRWVIDWMYTDVERSKGFAAMIREPGAKLCESMRSGIETASRLRATVPTSIVDAHLSKDALSSQRVASIEKIASTMAQRIVGHAAPVNVVQLKQACPGIYAMLGTAYSAWHASVSKNRKAPQPSDYGDALHALYAPYVHVFRADSSMGQHVRQHLSTRTHVVEKLNQLVPTIKKLLFEAQ